LDFGMLFAVFRATTYWLSRPRFEKNLPALL
jgi:hypothetical protein